MVRGIANSKIGFGDLILLLRYFFKLKVSTHPNDQYKLNHTDLANMMFGLKGLFAPDPVAMYRQHANRLKLQNL